MAARWAAHRAAAADGSGSDGGAWLDGPAARAVACDAALTPVVTGDVDPAALDHLVRLCVELNRLEHGAGPADDGPDSGADGSGPDGGADSGGGQRRGGAAGRQRRGGPAAGGCPAARPAIPAEPAAGHHRAGRRAAVRPGRAGQLPAHPAAGRPAGRAGPAAGHRVRHEHPPRHPQRGHPAGPALPLARRLQPARRRLPGPPRPAPGPRRPASLPGCVLLCSFHHQVAIHRWGWTLMPNPDGTTTARNPDSSKVLHSHGPPARAG